MKARLKRRVPAYLIDILLSIIIILIINSFLVNIDDKMYYLINILNEQYVGGAISLSHYINSVSPIYQEIDKANIINNFIDLIYIIIYFIILPYFNKGQTLGKKILKIKVVKKSNQKLTLLSLFLRNLIINGLIYLIVVTIFVYILPSNIYYITTTIFTILQLVLVMISIFMVLYRKDRRGLHDLISKTKVVNLD